MIKKVAIQGILGAFHEEAALKYYTNEAIELVPCMTFNELAELTGSCKVDSGIMAIENTIAGAILTNYALIESKDLTITGEIFIKIVQNLLAVKGVKIDQIDEVFSHPMAINQCTEFFKKYPKIKLTESLDTAMSAKDISESGSLNKAAIAGSVAAKRYDLNILNSGIEDTGLNYTRFFEIKKKGYVSHNNPDKSSICFNLPDKPGSLLKVLEILVSHQINMKKIQSHPIVGKPWEYSFYADIVFTDYTEYKYAISKINALTSKLKILGEYQSVIEIIK
jgi:prephenate dehydratase